MQELFLQQRYEQQLLLFFSFRQPSEEGKVNKSKKEKKRKRDVEHETDAMNPLEYYEAVKLQKKKKKEAKDALFR